MAIKVGTSGDDTLYGSSGNDKLFGNDGNDYLVGGEGNDLLKGGAGSDILDGGAGRDALYGGDGDDVIDAGAGDDLIYTDAGDDYITTGTGADTIKVTGTDIGGDTYDDFDPTTDKIDFLAIPGITSLHDLKFSEINGDTVVSSDKFSGTMTFLGVSAAQLQGAGVITVACFVRGTMIATPGGDMPVESLAIGDLVSTLGGIDRPVKWIGRRSYARRFIGPRSSVAPVVFRAGAIAPGVPYRDLSVSGKHAMFFDGLFACAEDLVNGDTVVRELPAGDTVDYFHIELDSQDVIFANGAPTETYVDHDSRRMFVNWRDYADLYGEQPAMAPGADGEFDRVYPRVGPGEPAFERIAASLAGPRLKVA